MKAEINSSEVLTISELMIQNTVCGCVSSMEILNREHSHEFSTWFLSYYLLGVNALELFAKLYLVKQDIKKGIDSKDVEERLKELGHNLERLYSEDVTGKEFLRRAEIVSVVRNHDNDFFVFQYVFSLTNGDDVYVYHAESIRYGLLAGQKSNAGFIAYPSDKLLTLCKNVQSAVYI